MPSLQSDDLTHMVQQIQDALVSSDGVRDGLHDEEAIPLMEWGATCAQHVGTRLALPDTPAPDADQVGAAAYALTRLLTRVNWVVTFRNKKDAAWLTRTFATINQLSRELYGETAPVLSDDDIAQWIADHPNHTNADLIHDLIARLTPPSPAAPLPGRDETSPLPVTTPPPDNSPADAPTGTLSGAVFGPASSPNPDSHSSGDLNEQTPDDHQIQND